MQGTHGLAQGKKGTGEGKTAVGIRVEPEMLAWMRSRVPALGNDAAHSMRALEDLRLLELGLGSKLNELRAMAILENRMPVDLMVDLLGSAIDAKKRKR